MKLTKKQREQVRMKFGGLCAYCGHPLPERWHVDHFEAVQREVKYTHHGVVSTGRMWKPENDRLNNMMPSCPPCNISKHSLSIESWRQWLAGHLRSLNEHYSIYRLMKSYGLLIETGKPIVFYFEQHGEQQNEERDTA